MSKTLSELIMKQSLKPRAPVMGNFPLTALETPPVEDFKTQYEQIVYEKAFKALRPNPNDVRKSKSYWEILEEQAKDKISDEPLPVKDITVRPLGYLLPPPPKTVRKTGATATASSLFRPPAGARRSSSTYDYSLPSFARSRSSSISTDESGDFSVEGSERSRRIDYSSGYGNIASSLSSLAIPARSRSSSFASESGYSIAPSSRTITQYDFNPYEPFVSQQFTPGAVAQLYEGSEERKDYLPEEQYDPFENVLQASESMGSRRSRSSSIASEISYASIRDIADDTTQYIQSLKVNPEERNALVALKDKEALYTDSPASRNYYGETTELSGLVRPSYYSSEGEGSTTYATSQYEGVGTSGLNLYGTRQGMTKRSVLDRGTNNLYAKDEEVQEVFKSLPNTTKEKLTAEIVNDLYNQASINTANIKGKRQKNEATKLFFINKLEAYRPFVDTPKEGKNPVIGRYNELLPSEKSRITKELKKPKYKKTYESILTPQPEFFKNIEQQLTKKDIANLLREQLMLKQQSKVGEKALAIEIREEAKKESAKKATKKGKPSIENIEGKVAQMFAPVQPVDF
ncbi:MAG: hypothetical protein YSLV7_ORF18 [Yellowstone Lake virophage 7]|uniref:hypothetical protein n=1 Tax=Yellowstone Lake virophage 7 TaxID=1557035 RepID=UPI0005363A8A|nr:MAG: hypothetical protein ASQ67_gp18 [Yellowstone Lake virophage 7]AIW01937.1 MAG: hypothetical protein YSLV7_ORF18 [Yellowstone Lake virophage 7]